MNIPKCAVCGEAATCGSQDLEEVAPSRDKNGIWWAVYKGLGMKYYCGKHEKPPKIKRLSRDDYGQIYNDRDGIVEKGDPSGMY